MELKPCPFCGGKATWGFHDCAHGEHTYCTQCGVEVAGDAEDWNRRSESAEDADFTSKYLAARKGDDMRQIAGVLSSRLRQMDRRAAAANRRADAAEVLPRNKT